MAEEKGVTLAQWDCTPDTSDAATFMSLWDNGFILRNAGEYLSQPVSHHLQRVETHV